MAGLTTFLTMAYIIVVNPAILEVAGIPKGPSMTATILSAAFGTLIMGVIAKRPFAIAPYMGENNNKGVGITDTQFNSYSNDGGIFCLYFHQHFHRNFFLC